MCSFSLAIVAGDLKNRQIGPRSHVWAEPDMLDKAAYEFSDVLLVLKFIKEAGISKFPLADGSTT